MAICAADVSHLKDANGYAYPTPSEPLTYPPVTYLPPVTETVTSPPSTYLPPVVEVTLIKNNLL